MPTTWLPGSVSAAVDVSTAGVAGGMKVVMLLPVAAARASVTIQCVSACEGWTSAAATEVAVYSAPLVGLRFFLLAKLGGGAIRSSVTAVASSIEGAFAVGGAAGILALGLSAPGAALVVGGGASLSSSGVVSGAFCRPQISVG